MTVVASLLNKSISQSFSLFAEYIYLGFKITQLNFGTSTENMFLSSKLQYIIDFSVKF